VVAAIFDRDPEKVGQKIADIIVQDVEELERVVMDQNIRIGVIAVPPEAAQDVADRLSGAGIRVILNYTSVVVRVPDTVRLHNTDPVRELLHTLYYLSRTENVARV
jgi:redox-sensing transcriptional repressor